MEKIIVSNIRLDMNVAKTTTLEYTLIKEAGRTDRDIVIPLSLDSPIRSCLPLRRALPKYLQETG